MMGITRESNAEHWSCVCWFSVQPDRSLVQGHYMRGLLYAHGSRARLPQADRFPALAWQANMWRSSKEEDEKAHG